MLRASCEGARGFIFDHALDVRTFQGRLRSVGQLSMLREIPGSMYKPSYEVEIPLSAEVSSLTVRETPTRMSTLFHAGQLLLEPCVDSPSPRWTGTRTKQTLLSILIKPRKDDVRMRESYSSLSAIVVSTLDTKMKTLQESTLDCAEGLTVL